MRESVFFEVRLRRFGIWRFAVGVVAVAAIAAMAAWLAAMWDSQAAFGRAFVVAVAAGLFLATVAIALSLGRVEGGRLTCRDGVWTFASGAGVCRTGTLEVAMDLGTFLLVRLVDPRRTTVWLPIQRRGLEAQWHALRCAVYSPPPLAAGSSTAPALPSE
jgi:hypothetical protein